MKRTACAIACSIFYLAGIVVLHFSSDAQFLAVCFGHIVWRVVRYKHLVGYGLYIFGKSGPGFFYNRFFFLSKIVFFCIFVILFPVSVCSVSYAGYCYGINAVVYVVYTLLFAILLLQPPHFAEIGSGGAFHCMYIVKCGLQVHTCISANYANIYPLSLGEPVGDFSHSETAHLVAPIVEVHSQIVALLYGFVFALFGGGAFRFFRLCCYLLFKVFYFLFPTEFFNNGKCFIATTQLAWQFCLFYLAVETAVA